MRCPQSRRERSEVSERRVDSSLWHPLGFFTRNKFPAVSCISHRKNHPIQDCQLCPSFSKDPLSHSRGGGIVENGPPYAAWKCQNQKSRLNSLNRGHSSLSDQLVVYVISEFQKPGLHDRISMAYGCSSEYLGVSKKLRPQQDSGLTKEIHLHQNHDSPARLQAGLE